MKKNILNGNILALIMLFTVSCSDKYLNFEPEGKLPEEGFFITEVHAEQAVNAIYAHMRTWGQVAFPLIALQEMSSDNALKGSAVGDASYLNDFVYFKVLPTNKEVSEYWSFRYKGVKLSTEVIDNIDKTSTEETKKIRLTAEAKFLRAYFYFDLVRAFGDIPLVISSKDAVVQSSIRAPKAEVFAQIKKDLTEAIQGLPKVYDPINVGRVTKGAAQTLLAKVYVYEKDWSKAVSLTNEVITSGVYALMPDFWKMFRIESDNCAEFVFEIVTPYDPGDWSLTNCQYADVQSVRGEIGWGFNAPTDNLASAFDAAGDSIRKNATIIYYGKTTPDGDTIKGIGINEMEGVDIPRYNGKVYSTIKERNDLGQWSNWGQNIRVIRYAEVLLLNAEAKLKSGDLGGAAAALNTVRTRVGLPAIVSPTVEQIWNERRLELAMENDRFFDLVRTGLAPSVLSLRGFVTGRNEVFPIPQDIIDMTNGTITQNQGY